MKAKLIALAGLLLLGACAKEKPIDGQDAGGKQVTIRVSVPEAGTRVAFTPEDGKLALSWEEGDCLRVTSGSTSNVFTLSRIISAHEAEFTGTEVPGSSFEILFPGTYANWDEADDDRAIPAQHGNGSTSHLRYKAFIDEVDTYTDIAFTSSWAEAHGGFMREAVALKLQAKLPEGVTALKDVNFWIDRRKYTLPLEDVDVSGNGQVLTAYMMLNWDDQRLSDGSTVLVAATDADGEMYSATLPISGDKVLRGGMMNSFTGVKLALQDFLSGDGTEENPYLIATARQLDNIHKAGILVSETLTHFQLVEDIDRYPKISVFGILKGETAAINLQTSLLMLGKYSHTQLHFSKQIEYLEQADEDDLIILFSYTGIYFDYEYPNRRIPPNVKRPKVWFITGNTQVKKSEYINEVLYFSSRQNQPSHPYQLQAVGDIIAQSYAHYLAGKQKPGE